MAAAPGNGFGLTAAFGRERAAGLYLPGSYGCGRLVTALGLGVLCGPYCHLNTIKMPLTSVSSSLPKERVLKYPAYSIKLVLL